MPGSDQKRIVELGRIARGEEYGVRGRTINSAKFLFTEIVEDSWCCEYSISGNNLGRLEGCSGRPQTYRTTNEDDALQILQMFVASATLENLCFHFFNYASAKPDDFNRLMRAVFPVVCTSRRLATLSISIEGVSIFDTRGSWLLAAESGVRHFLETGFPLLLRDNPVFYLLTVAADSTTLDYQPYRLAEVGGPCSRLEYSFSRNEAKDSRAGWTLQMFRTNKHMETGSTQEMFALFPAGNALLKEVVLCCRLEHSCWRCREDIADLVARNFTTLERLNAGGYCFSPADSSLTADAESVPRALRCNRSLKEFEYRCTLAELHELVQVFAPDWGRKSNSSLSTLKVHIAGSPPMVDCMVALAPLHGATVAALKHVIVCGAEEPWEFTVSSDDSQPHPNVGGVTLSRLRVCDTQLRPWPSDLGEVSGSLTVMEEVLRMSTALAQVEIGSTQLCEELLSQRTGSSSVVAVHDPGRLAPCEFEWDVQGKVRKGLKRLLKELSGNTCMQSLRVGWWRLVRVGAGDDEWEMRYDGPCLRRPDEYHVVVEL